ncbi:PadR family transcriptional regulator [soil metagenome]
MALEHAILVSLAERSASGYDLARRFDKSIGHFWNASHQQIYKVLGRMESEKWVASDLVAQDGRPDKRVYAVTEEGRDELMRWSREPAAIEPLRSEFAVKMRGLAHVDQSAVVRDIRERRAVFQALLEFYRSDVARNFPNPTALSDSQVGPYMVLRGGIYGAEGEIAWCDESLALLVRR